MKKHLEFGTKAVGFLLLVISWMLAVQVQAKPGIQVLENQPAEKRIAMELEFADIRVASFGDDVVVRREFKAGKWVWNKQWNSVLSKRVNPTGGTNTNDGLPSFPWSEGHDWISRNGAIFTNASSTKIFSTLTNNGEVFESSKDALVWKDKNDNWIRFTPENPEQEGVGGGDPMWSHIHSYGNGVYSNTLTLDEQHRITEIHDTFGNLLLTFSYLGTTDLPTRIEDYTGRAVTYTYNSENQLTEVTDVRGQTWAYTYHSEKPLVTSTEDPNGNVASYSYDQNSITVVTADQLATKYTYQYDKASHQFRRTISEPDGRIRETVYNNAPVNDSVARYQSFVNGELVAQRFRGERAPNYVNAAGEVTAHERYAFGKTTKITHPDGTTEEWIYSADGIYLKAYINRRGIRNEWDYDDKGRVTEERLAAGLPEQRTTRYSYPDLLTRITTVVGDAHISDSIFTERFDQYGNLESVTDAENNTTLYTHNVLGQELTATLPSGVVYTYEYDNAGNITKETDPLNRVTSYTYDPAGNLKTITWPNQAVTTYGYNALNLAVSETNALNQTTQTTFDRQTRTFTVTNPQDATNTVQMDVHSRPALIEDANGNVTRRNYDDGRLVSVQFPTFEKRYEYGAGSRLKAITDHYDGKQSRTQLKIDPLGQLEQQIDANQNQQVREYNGLGQLVKVTDALGGITSLTYDSHGNLIQVTDPENRSVWFEHNGNGQIVAEERRPTSGDISRRTYQYDIDGNLSAELTPNGEKIVYGYNAGGELTSVTEYPSESASAPSQLTEMGYSALGQVTSYDDGQTSGSYTYNELGQLKTATTNYGPFSKSISYTYDAVGKIASYTNPENVTYTYSYDANGQITSINIPGAGALGFTDYHWTRPTRITLPGGSVIQRQYDGLQRLATNTVLDPAQQALMNISYGYDAVGNILDRSTEHGAYSYGYDSLYRLTSSAYPSAEDETFEYDGVGNRTRHNDGSAWQYNDANQLIQSASATYKYDSNGHVITKTEGSQSWHYIYDESERLVRIEHGDGAVLATYAYNPFGYRMWKEVDGNRTYFFYNHQGMVGEYSSSGELAKEYHYLPYSTWMTAPLFQRVSGSVHYYLNDHLGTPKQLVNTSGQVVWEARYNAFGKAAVTKDAVSNNLRFPGQYYDAESGLHHNYFRDYDPELGRYIQSDPIGLEGGINTYGYAHQNPLVYSDPTGEIAPAVWAYARCIASCKAFAAAASAITGECDDTTVGDCALDCLNPLNWLKFKGPKIGGHSKNDGPDPGISNVTKKIDDKDRGNKQLRKKPGSLGQSKGTDALRRENKKPRDAAKKYKLNKDQQKKLHDEISGQGYSYDEILEVAKDIKDGKI